MVLVVSDMYSSERMTDQPQDFAYSIAVEVYGEFLQTCVIEKVGSDRIGKSNKVSSTKIDGRPVRLVTISGKGGWSDNPKKAKEWAKFANISLLDHCLSVARGALIFYVIQASDDVNITDSWEDIKNSAYALVCIAFLHDIDKDLQLERGTSISVSSVAERMSRYGIDSFLSGKGISISPEAMLNYIEEVEGSQSARNQAAPDYDRNIAVLSRYIEVADKLEGMFLDQNSSVGNLISSLENLNQWPILKNTSLRQWEVIQIHDHLHTFLLDHFQIALSRACKRKAGILPLIEIVHDGILLCIIPRAKSREIREEAIKIFIASLPFGLRFSTNNRLACEFVGGIASWDRCKDLMGQNAKWNDFRNLFALPREFASKHVDEIDILLDIAELKTSWGGLGEEATGATVKPFGDHPIGSYEYFTMNSVAALAFLTIVLNHKDKPGKGNAPSADTREQELLEQMETHGHSPPEIYMELNHDHRARRVFLAIWVISKLWDLASEDEANAENLFNKILGCQGLIGIWMDGEPSRKGIRDQVVDNSSNINIVLEQYFKRLLSGKVIRQYDAKESSKHCFLCNVPTSSERKVNTSYNAHGVKSSAFSGRDGRNDHLASPGGDTHLCLVCQAELKLRYRAQSEYKGSKDLPPLVSSPITMGLFGGLVYPEERDYRSMGLNDLGRLDMAKGEVYKGLDVQTQRIRIARLENLPRRDAKLVVELRRILKAIQRLGRPIHLFQGAPSSHPAIFYSDALPFWLKCLLGDDCLRIEQLDEMISTLEFFEIILNSPGLGTEWAKQMVDPSDSVKLGAFCVAWAEAMDRSNSAGGQVKSNLTKVEYRARQGALRLLKKTRNNGMKIQDNQDPLVRLAWLATRVQKRVGNSASVSKQLLCWKTALSFFSHAQETITNDQAAMILGLAATLEDDLKRGSSDAAAKKHRDGQSLQDACIDFASHFAKHVWVEVFKSKEPASQDQRRASAIYRFALLEAYRERGIAEADNNEVIDTQYLSNNHP